MKVFLVAFVCGVCCSENLPSQLLLQPKKRGVNDHSITFPSESSSSYSAPSSLSSGYDLGGSSGSFSLGHGGYLNSGGSFGQRIGYSLAPSGGLGSGYQSPGLSHDSLNQQSASLGGYSAQSTYSVPSIANLGSGSSNALFTPAKTGPVTFGVHGGSSGATSTSSSNSYSAPVYASGGQGLSAYSNGGTSGGFQIVLGSPQHGLSQLSSSGTSSGYSLPAHSASSSPSQTVTGGLIIASPSHGGSPSYNLPASSSSHGISASSGIYGGSSTYSLPINSGSHGISALSSHAGSPSYSGSYSSSGLSGVSSGSSSYETPIASGSYSNSGSSNAISHANYQPSYSSSSSSSYSSPSVSYATPVNHASSSGSGYSGGGASYTVSSNYVASSSNPVVTYTGSHGYTPTYYSSSSSHGTPTDSQGSYASISPKYLGYNPGIKFYNVDSGNTKYDTISYSVPSGKY
ncbi:uncharacterized protein [Cardiocondyla obscurior]|uniref:uncharacterized protein n=1 Tax=Cardiocondyla obscurior TaxID=286306 RepID=UPI00396571A3